MLRPILLGLCVFIAVFTARSTSAQEPANGAPSDKTPGGKKESSGAAEPVRSATSLVAKVLPSIVTIKIAGREGAVQAMGAGFVVSPDGLIVTNYHVIGESRPLTVELAHGRKMDVDEIYASDRHVDLAVIRVKLKNETLPALELADVPALPQGEAIATVGNPLGLQRSVVTGVVSAEREIDGRKMIQVSMPIQPGNSGGPLLDVEGRVHGVVAMMSGQQPNIGFAIPIQDVKRLLDKPNPIPMNRWLVLGAIDRKKWTPLFGADWRQRGGRILVSGVGAGFGGRSLSIFQPEPPMQPYQLAVSVKMKDESGAAGLVFHADGGDRHYGFYPSSGRMRLSRFEGPDVQSWNVLNEVATPHYRPGEWNDLKVFVDKARIRCFVNGQLVIDSKDDGLTEGRVGLAKFRHTEAEFRGFRVSQALADEPRALAENDVSDQLSKIPRFSELRSDDLKSIADQPAARPDNLREQARQFEKRAAEFRKLASDVELNSSVKQLVQHIQAMPGKFDLLRAALLLAQVDEGELDIDSYVSHVERMASEIKQSFASDITDQGKIEALNRYLFTENGFHGSRFDYDHRANSYLNRVIDDREGIPITLSVLYMELAKRLDLTVVGVGLPGHFVVRLETNKSPPNDENGPGIGHKLIDVFDAGKLLTHDDANRMVLGITGSPISDEHLRAATPEEIMTRMTRNLIAAAERQDDKEGMLRYYHVIVGLQPDSVSDRGLRAVLRSETGRRAAAIEDLDWILDRQPKGIDLARLRQMRKFFEERGM